MTPYRESKLSSPIDSKIKQFSYLCSIFKNSDKNSMLLSRATYFGFLGNFTFGSFVDFADMSLLLTFSSNQKTICKSVIIRK